MDWWNPSTPENMSREPWMHPAAVLYLNVLLSPRMSVIEHGCGGSTLWLALRCHSLYSYDIDDEWVKVAKEKTFKYENVLVNKQADPPEHIQADLLLIDGNNYDRPAWILAAPRLVVPGGVVVIDNSNRPHYREALRELATFCTLPTVIQAWTGYGKEVHTSFYRLKGGTNWI